MSLIVPSAPRNTVLSAGAAAPSGVSLKWLWAAIAVLGVSVVALGTTLVVQHNGKSAPEASPTAVAAQPLAELSTLSNALQNKPSQQSNQRNIAANNGAYRGPAHPAEPVGLQAGYAQQPMRTAAPAPICASCGRVESVEAVQQAAPPTGVGAVAGGVLGAVVGNQVGKGSGRAAATVLGAVGGGYVGHKVEERTRTQTVYQIAVRMEDGSVRRFTRSQPTAVGTPVVLQGKGFRVDDGTATRAADPYSPAPQPGTVRVADTY